MGYYFQPSGTDANSNDSSTNSNGSTNANANNNGQNNPDVTGAQTENVWTNGRILVVYMGSDPSTIELLSRVTTPSSSTGTDANGPGGMDTNANGNGTSGSGSTGTNTTGANLPAGVLTAIQSYAAQQFGATAGSVQVVAVLRVQFQESCLGTNTNANGNNTGGTGGTSADHCAQVVTPGWAVTVLVNGQQYVQRSGEGLLNVIYGRCGAVGGSIAHSPHA